MAKKFFYNKVYNTRKTIINVVIIVGCIIGVIVCFIFVSNFQGESHNKQVTIDLKSGVTIEVNEKYTNEIFLTKIDDNFDLDKLHVSYPDNFDISTPGNYNLKITVDGDKDKEEYEMPMTIVDTIMPDLKIQSLTIAPNTNYTVNDFVIECSDNSNKNCKIDFYNGVDEDGNKINYASYNKEGNYSIKVVASDDSGNQNIQETTLTIREETAVVPPIGEPDTKPVCKYGSNDYDYDQYTLTTDVSTNGCALSLDLYKDDATMAPLKKVMDNEFIKLNSDATKLNLEGVLSIHQKINVIVNRDGSGIVGYELIMSVTRTDKNNNKETVVEYKVNKEGKRIYLQNPYRLG